MDHKKLKALIDLVSNTRIAELEIAEGKERIRIVKAAPVSIGISDNPPSRTASAAGTKPVPAVTSPQPAESISGHVITAPMYGVLHLSPSPGEPPFVSAGDEVQEGQELCLMETMKVFSTVSSDRAGRVVAVLAEADAEVEAGQPLFRIQ